MRAIILDLKLPRYLTSKALGKFWQGVYYSSVSCLSLRDVPEPRIPGDDWVKIRTIYSGLCASDISGILFRNKWDSFITAYISFPIGLGHEIVGRITQTGKNAGDFAEGDRVAVSPYLGCAPRGINPPCKQCRQGHYSVCENFTKGNIATGTTIGNNRDTNGGWGEYLVAHRSQLYRIPDEVPDADAALVDPCACAVHAVLKAPPGDEDKVIVYGVGTIGLCLIASLRALGRKSTIIAVGRYPYQLEKAKELGADVALYDDANLFEEIAAATGADVVKARFGFTKKLNGGADVIFDCVGTSATIDKSLRLCRSSGTLVLLGMGYPEKVDWLPICFNEITIKGCIASGIENYNGKHISAFDIVIELLAQGKLNVAGLVTHKCEIGDYKKALAAYFDKKNSRQIKTLFYAK